MASIQNPSQSRIMRVVRGAVHNAADAHPEMKFDRRIAGSIAKRAAGTLTAEWPDVLAARLARRQKRVSAESHEAEPRWGATSGPVRRSPLKLIWRKLSRVAGEARRAGNEERLALAVEVLRLIAEMQRQETEAAA